MFVWRLVPETKGKTLEETSMFWKKARLPLSLACQGRLF